MIEVKVSLSRHVEQAVRREALNRKMGLSELCAELIDVALVQLGKYNKTSIDDYATMNRGESEERDDTFD